MKDTNIYKISDIQKSYQCSYEEAKEARKLLWFISRNIDKLEKIIQNDSQEELLQFCLKYAYENKSTF